MPMMSVSWKASRPIIARGTCPVIATTGELSMCAVASPVTKFVAPGPDVATHTPTRPLARVVAQGVVERHDGAAGVPEDHVDASLHQCAAENLGAREHLSHRLTLPRGRWR